MRWTLSKCSSIFVTGSIEAIMSWSFSNFTGTDGVLIVRLSQTSVVISLSIMIWVGRSIQLNLTVTQLSNHV